MGYNKTAIAAAFSTVARLVREGQPVVLSKVEGLNSFNARFFRQAVTHNFNEKDHGFNLQRIFIIDKENPQNWHRNTSPNKNPDDATLIDLVIKAMQWVYAHYEPVSVNKQRVVVAPAEPVKVITLADFTLEELKEEVARREKAIAREELAKKLGVSENDLGKIAETILSLL